MLILRFLGGLWRISARWVAMMSGLFSLIREVTGAVAAASGHPIEANNSLRLFGHLSVAVFIIAGFSEWCFLQQRIKALENAATRPGQENVPGVLQLIDAGRALKEGVPGEDASGHDASHWNVQVKELTEKTEGFLKTCSMQASAVFLDTSRLLSCKYDVHPGVEDSLNELNHRIGNLTKIAADSGKLLC
jgi:hypothetical protein